MVSFSSLPSLTGKLVNLAEAMRLDPVSAVALPATIESCARKVGWTEAAIVAEAERNVDLRDYIAGICRNCDVAAALA